MANRYVYSGAGGAGTGADWANAYTTLAAALTAGSAGDDFFVAQDHAETQASAMTLTSPGTIANPCRIFCVNRAGSVPPVAADLATTGTVSTTGANNMVFAGYVSECYGLTFTAGNSTSSAAIQFGAAAAMGWKLKSSSLILGGSGGGSRILGNPNAGCDVELVDCVVKFSGAAQAINGCHGVFRMTGGSYDATTAVPTNFIIPSASRPNSILRLDGVDLSGISSGNIVGVALSSYDVLLTNCKLHASATPVAAQTIAGVDVQVLRCSAADSNVDDSTSNYLGVKSVETTIVRTGGATDGTTTIAHKIVTTANASQAKPFRSQPIVFWNETVGSAITITLQGIWGGGAVPDNDEVWMEVGYPGATDTPLYSFANDGKASPLATEAAQTAGSGTWGGSTTAFSLDVTVTPQNKGPITLWPMVGLASGTFYIDPKPIVT